MRGAHSLIIESRRVRAFFRSEKSDAYYREDRDILARLLWGEASSRYVEVVELFANFCELPGPLSKIAHCFLADTGAQPGSL